MSAGKQFAMEIRAEVGRVVFRYAVVQGDEQRKIVEQPVEISWTPCNYGGERPWFGCPVCRRRGAILYHVNPYLGLQCRVCAGLLYESQRLARLSRIHRRMDKLRGRVIDGGDGNWYKPPRMHWSTFDRVCDQADDLNQGMRADAAAFVEKLMRR